MRYMDSLKYVMAKEGWFMNLLMCAVCILIPVIGGIVVMGYMFEVFDALRRDPEQKDYPKFDWGNFSRYLMRGIWIFLVQLVTQAIVMIPIGIVTFVAVFLTILVAKAAGPLAIVVWLLFALVALVIGVAVGLIQVPMKIYAGIRQGFDFGAMVSFARDFIRKMWKETLLSILLMTVVALVLLPIGYVLCILPMYLVIAYILMGQHHLDQQLYTLYLERGGIPVPEKSRREFPSDEALSDPTPRSRRDPSGPSDGITADPPR